MYYLIKIIFKNFTERKRCTVTSWLSVSPFAPGSPLLSIGCQPGPQPGSVPLCQVPTTRPSLFVEPWAAEGSVHGEAGCRLRLERGECHWQGLSKVSGACGARKWPRCLFFLPPWPQAQAFLGVLFTKEPYLDEKRAVKYLWLAANNGVWAL